jgi:hypothetical protein
MANEHQSGMEILGSMDVRVSKNRHFASMLRKRLESRHGAGALRQMLAQLTDTELIEAYLSNENLKREHAAARTEKGGGL